MERQEEERRKQYETQRPDAEKQLKEQAAAAAEEAKKSEEPEPEPAGEDNFTLTEGRRAVVGVVPDPAAKDAIIPDPVLMALTSIGSSFFAGESKWPDGIAFALTLENESIDVRALFVNEPGEKSDTVPFMPALIPGPPVVFEAPNVLPADTDIFVTMSLDLPQVYTLMSRSRSKSMVYSPQGNLESVEEISHESPFAAIEKKLKMNLKDDLLPLLGSEVAVRLPATGLALVGMSPAMVIGSGQPVAGTSPVILISLKDKEAVRALMPKIVEALGFKGASAFAQTEKKEDTEIVSYLNAFSYAFVGNFLVLSGDAASIRHVVDSYLKHETLAGESNFKNFTRWQPRPAHGQIYVSPALMESYKAWADTSKQVTDPAKAFLIAVNFRRPPNQSLTRYRTKDLDHYTNCTFRRISC